MKISNKFLTVLVLIIIALNLIALNPTEANAANAYVSSQYYGYNSDQSITVNYSGASEKDWIGIYKRNTNPSNKPCDAALAWKYVTGSGSVTFYPNDFVNSPYSPQKGNVLEPGDYKIVLLKNDGYEVATESNFEIYGGNPLYSFQVISDAHITSDGRTNVNLERALKDINKFNPTSKNDKTSFLIMNGDSVDDIRGYSNLVSTFKSTNESLSKYNQKVPYVFSTLGNHELYDTVGKNTTSYASKLPLLKKNFDIINNAISQKTSNGDNRDKDRPYYEANVNGVHLFFLGSQSQNSSTDADLHHDQLEEWLDNRLWHIATYEKDAPVFVFCHQGLPKTVAGTYALPDRPLGWSGVTQYDALKFILNKYPNVFFFSGHSHWNLSAKNTMYQEPKATYGNGIGATLFNTGAVSNLWSDNNDYMDGSQGYQVDVYSDKVVIRGRDFLHSKWMPEARFSVSLKPKYNSLHQIYTKQ